MSFSCDETCDIYHEEFPRARKEHTCCACGETIVAGHKYARVFILYDGRKTNYKRYLRCQTIHEHLRELCRGVGDMWPQEDLGCGIEYEEEWGAIPDDIASLAFGITQDELEKIRERHGLARELERARQIEKDYRRWSQSGQWETDSTRGTYARLLVNANKRTCELEAILETVAS